jgi:VWFA-related protein
MRRGPSIVVTTILVGPVLAASLAEPPATTTASKGFEQVTVRLAQFDVVVRDASGKFVSGLGPGDFKVFEDGSPLEIVAVDEWGGGPQGTSPSPASSESTTGGEASTPPPPSQEPERRSFVLVFDALGESTALRMNQAKRAAVEFVRTRFKSGDVGCVYQLDLTLRSLSGVTSDRDVLVRGIEQVAWMPASSLADQVSESVLAYTGQTNQSVARERLSQQSANVAGQLDWQREHVYQSLGDLANVFQSMPGKRALVLASPGFPMTTNADQRLQTGGFTLKFQNLIKSMATYGITVYSIDIGSELTAGDASAAIDWRVAAGKLGMDENVLTDLGLERTLGTNSASSRRQFLGVVAAETGGRMLTDTNLARSFATIDEESAHFYRLSCRVPVSSANRYRGFKVTVSRDKCTVATRRGRYSDIAPLERAPGGKDAAVPVDSLAGYKRLSARGTAFPLPAGETDRIPIVVVLQVVGPVELPVNAEGASNLDLDVRIVARAAEEIVSRYERGFTATLKRGSDPVRAGFRIEGRLELPPGIYDVQGTVRLAAPAQLATWAGTVAVPPQSKTSPTILGPMLIAADDAAVPLLSQPPQPAADALAVKSGTRFLPATASEFAPEQPLLAMFWLKGFASADDPSPSVEFSANLVDAAGTVVPAPSQLLYFGRAGSGALCAIVRFDNASVRAGTYLLQVAATPPGAATAITRRTSPFAVRQATSTPGVTSASGP